MPVTAYPVPLKSMTLTLPVTPGQATLLFGPDANTPQMGLPLNTKTIVLANLDTTNAIWVEARTTATPGTVLVEANCTVIPAGTAFTMEVGPVGYRPDPNQSGWVLYVQEAAGTPKLSVSLIMTSGSLGV